jgi:hypothetical protein
MDHRSIRGQPGQVRETFNRFGLSPLRAWHGSRSPARVVAPSVSLVTDFNPHKEATMNSQVRLQLRAGLLIALVSMFWMAYPSTSSAYQMTGVGGKFGFTSPEGLDGTVTVAGQLEFTNDNRVHLVPNLAYWKVDQVSDVNPNMDVYYHFHPETQPSPYVGGGVGVDVRNSDLPDRTGTSLSANVIGGYRFPSGSNHYFVEGRFTASEESRLAVVGGITFNPR